MASGSTAIDGFLEAGCRRGSVLCVLRRGVLAPRQADDPKDADRTGDVLDALLAEILECELFQSLADLVAHGARDADAAGLGEHFEPRRDVDAVAKDVVVLDDHVAEIDADAELDPPRRRDVGVASRHPALDLGRAQHRIGDAVELDQHAVAGGLDDAALVLGDGRIDQLDPMGLETRERARLVGLHQPAVADHVGGEDRCEPALWSRHVHLFGSLPRTLADERPLPKPRAPEVLAGQAPHSIPERLHIGFQDGFLLRRSLASCLRSRTMVRSALTSKPLPLASA